MTLKLPKISAGKVYKVGKAFFTKHSADILTGFTACGVVVTAVETHRATLKASEYLQINGYDQANPDTQKVLKVNAAKNYILPVATGALTIGAAVGANYINHKQIAGLAAACTVAETALNEHRDKIEELLGEKTLAKVDDAMNLDKGHDILLQDDEVYVTGKGDVLCCEGYLTGRKFRASTDWVKRCVNEFNNRVNNDEYAGYDEFLLYLWESCPNFVIPQVAEHVGYNVHSNGLLRIRITSDIDESTGEPYMVFAPANPPIANFMEIF